VPAGESYCDEDCERILRDQPAAADREPATGVLRVPYQVIRLVTPPGRASGNPGASTPPA
jgi:hypothetical protein